MESEEFKSNFSETWADASRKFRAAADRAGARLERIPLPHLDGALCVDVAVFQGESSSAADSTPRKISSTRRGNTAWRATLDQRF